MMPSKSVILVSACRSLARSGHGRLQQLVFAPHPVARSEGDARAVDRAFHPDAACGGGRHRFGLSPRVQKNAGFDSPPAGRSVLCCEI